MPKRTTEPAGPGDLRSRAVSQLKGHGQGAHQSALEAFGVLHELASSPSTAADALALLHELQVHQVELDLQAEELRASRAELEAALQRQVQLYESAPVGCFTIDLGGALRELNLTGAALLGHERDVLLGQPLFRFLAPHSVRELRGVLMSASEGHGGTVCTLQLIRGEADARMVYATVSADPAGSSFLVAMMDAGASDRAQGSESAA